MDYPPPQIEHVRVVHSGDASLYECLGPVQKFAYIPPIAARRSNPEVAPLLLCTLPFAFPTR